MNKTMFVVLIVGAFASSDGIYYADQTCSCDQLQTQYDCGVMGGGLLCNWDGSSCSAKACSEITNQSACASNVKCMWQNNACTTFTFCSQLSGQTQLACLMLSTNCPYTNGSTCGGKNQLKQCSQLTASIYCEGYISNDGVCIWRDTTCSAAQNCSVLTQSECLLADGACYYSGTGCVQLTCANISAQATCTMVATTIYNNQRQLCEWNATTSKCSNAANMASLTAANCYSQTGGCYEWSPSSTGGSCQACYSAIITVVLTILMILI